MMRVANQLLRREYNDETSSNVWYKITVPAKVWKAKHLGDTIAEELLSRKMPGDYIILAECGYGSFTIKSVDGDYVVTAKNSHGMLDMFAYKARVQKED